MKYVLAAILFIWGAGLRAQSAVVQPLTESEAAEAKTTYQTLQDAQAAWDKFQSKLTIKYNKYCNNSSVIWSLDKNGNVTNNSDCRFSNGFTFSSDFKFIVPNPAPQPTNCNWNNGWNYNGCITLTPSTSVLDNATTN